MLNHLTWVDVAIFIAILLVIRYLRIKPVLYSILMMPGTILHEFAHFAIGVTLGAKPVRVSLLPKIHAKQGVQLGSVSFARLRWWNALPVALAPLLLVPLSLWLFVMSLNLDTLWSLLAKLSSAIFLYSAIPSQTDMKHALRALLVFAAIAIVTALLVFAFSLGSWK